MQGASRDTLAAVQEQLRRFAGASDPQTLARVADEMFSVGELIDGNPILRRLLTDPSSAADAKAGLLSRLLSNKVGDETASLLESAVRGGWGAPGDLSDAVDALGRESLLYSAEREGRLDTVEDELFRFGRVLAREPELQLLLSDRTRPTDRRIGLLAAVVGDKVSPQTKRLLEQATASSRGRGLEHVVGQISTMAAVRRDRLVAVATSVVPLTAEQHDRLVAALTRIYGRDVELRVEVEPDLLGGMVVKVGDEVIDGSVVHKLSVARRALA
ncbi:MAG: F0F1 ATP synthase subunit delta [Mycobacteriales bacterium]